VPRSHIPRIPFREIARFLGFVLRRWNEDRCPQIAGSLTYTTLLVVAPMFAIAVAVLSSAPLFEDVVTNIKIFLLLNLAPQIAGTIITVYMEEFARNAARLTTLGVVLVLGLAVWLMLIMDRSLNAIWRIHRSRPYWISVVGYAALLVAGPILIGFSVSLTTHIMTLTAGVDGFGVRLHALLLRLVPIATSAVAFFLVYRIVPHREVPWRHALLGGGVAALLFEGAKQLFGIYVGVAPTYSVIWGAFAAIPLALIWVYLSWLVVLFGAELTACAGYWRDGLWKRIRTPGMRFREAVGIVRALIASPEGTLSFAQLKKETALPAGELEETLAQMVEGEVIRRSGRSAYELAPGTREVIAGAPAREPPPVRKARRGRARSARSSR
jgi:membrane protein